jgi:hypothetical protein
VPGSTSCVTYLASTGQTVGIAVGVVIVLIYGVVMVVRALRE